MEINKDGNFVLCNCGRRPIYVDGQALLTNKSLILKHHQLVEVNYASSLLTLAYISSDLLLVISSLTEPFTR